MALEIQSLIKKKIDNSGCLAFFFEVVKRPPGSFLFELEFSKSESEKEPFLEKLELPGLRKNYTPTKNGFGYFNVIAPDGFDWDTIRIRSKVALFKPWSGWQKIEFPQKFEDVYQAEIDYHNELAKQKSE